MIICEDIWTDIQPSLTKKQKREASKLRKRFYTKIKELRADIVNYHFAEHVQHCFVQITTNYINDIFEREDILCNCGDILIINKQKMEKANNGPLKIIHTT